MGADASHAWLSVFVPGWGFGETLKHAVRLSYGPLVHNLDKIDVALKRVGEFLKQG